jgi:predicted transcriptional regulator
MLTKAEVLKSLQSLPGKFQAEDAIEKIVLLEKIRIGMEQSKNGEVVTKDEVKRKLKKWLK